jgi:hypothetical protein
MQGAAAGISEVQKHSFVAEKCCSEKMCDGARRGTRTPTTLRLLGPKPSASANSAIRASFKFSSAWPDNRPCEALRATSFLPPFPYTVPRDLPSKDTTPASEF